MEAIAFEATLKLLKQSRLEEAKLLKKFLSSEMLQALEELEAGGQGVRLEGDTSPLKASPFY